MAKKLWINAEVVELGVESTREYGIDTVNKKPNNNENMVLCPYCSNGKVVKEKNMDKHILKKHPEQREIASMLPEYIFSEPTYS